MVQKILHRVPARALAGLIFFIATASAIETSSLYTSQIPETTVPTFTTTLGSSKLSVGSVESFLGKKLVDPATSIFVSNKEDEASENMARYFFFNSNVGSFNTSVSFTIPLFSFSMPDFSGSLLNDLGINTLFSLACLGILFFGGLALLPFIFAYYGAGTLLPFFGGRSFEASPFSAWSSTFNGYLDSESTTRAAAAVEAAIAKFASALGDQCAKRTVCEAHAHANARDNEEGDEFNEVLANPLAGPIRAFFPVPNLEKGHFLEDMTLSPFQVAALYGRSKNANCSEHYKLCFVSMLDSSAAMSKYLVKAFDEVIRRK